MVMNPDPRQGRRSAPTSAHGAGADLVAVGLIAVGVILLAAAALLIIIPVSRTSTRATA